MLCENPKKIKTPFPRNPVTKHHAMPVVNLFFNPTRDTYVTPHNAVVTRYAIIVTLGRHTEPVFTRWCTASVTDLREHFLRSSVFYLTLLSAFSALPWGRHFNLKLAGLHVDHWNIVSARLFVWFTALHKRV